MFSTVINGFLAVITAIYVIFTWRILKANHEIVRIMDGQFVATTRPYMVIDVICPRAPILTLRIRNLGASAAENLKLTINKTFYRLNQKRDDLDLSKEFIFNSVVRTYAPKAELLIELGVGFQIFKEPELTPLEFEINASYEYSGRQVQEVTHIDLNVFRGTTTHPNAVVEELQRLREAIEKLRG